MNLLVDVMDGMSIQTNGLIYLILNIFFNNLKELLRLLSIRTYLGQALLHDLQVMKVKMKKKELKHLIIAGPPAGGKGTQCDFLKAKYDLVHLSTGDLLREEVKKESNLGKEAKVYMDKGELVPNNLLIGVVQQRLKNIEDSGKGWLLDGFPRTEDQAVALTERGVRVNGFILLDVPDEVVTDRMEGRRWDPVTNQTYHLKYRPPPPESLNRLVIRSDDNLEKFKVRLGEYHKNVNAVKGFFKTVLHSINGNQSPEKVSDAIVSALESHH